MKKLLVVVVLCVCGSSVYAANEIVPFCQSYTVTSTPGDVNAFCVPADKVFILLRLNVDSLTDGLWQIYVDNTMWLNGQHSATKNFISSYREFPEGSAVVQSGKALWLKKINGGTVYYTIVGYFRDAVVTSAADINGDGNVNLLDLAALGNQWLK